MTPTPFEELITKAGQNPSLLPAKRLEMRSALESYMSANPLPLGGSGMLSPYHAFFDTVSSTLRQPAFALAAVVLIVAASSGVAYAAEGSLPGDALYPLKVAIVEPLQTSLTFSADAKSAWQMQLAERRVHEAATLADQGRLSTSTEAVLAASFVESANAATASSSDTFVAALSADADTLATIDAKQGKSSTSALQGAIHAEIAVRAPGGGVAAAAASTTTAAAARPVITAAMASTTAALAATATTSASTTIHAAVMAPPILVPPVLPTPPSVPPLSH